MSLTIDQTTLLKALNPDGTCYHGGNGRWHLPKDGKPGRWKHVRGELIPCENGLHVCTLSQLPDWAGPALFTVEIKGDREDARDKTVVRHARLLARVETWNDRTLRLWACDCAERALDHIKDADPRSRDAIVVARRFANGEATAEQLAAAWAAAWDAAGDAAGAAARAAARATAGAAARATARATAWDAAGAAARAAAGDEERAWQVERLRQYLAGEVE